MAPFRWAEAYVESHNSPLYACAFNPYTRPEFPLHLAVAGINQVSIYEVADDELTPIYAISDPTLAIQEDPDPGCRASAVKTNCIYAVNWLFDETSEMLMVVFGGDNGVIRVVDASTGKEVRVHAGHGNAVNDIRVHPKQFTMYASASKDMTIRVWSSLQSAALTVIACFEGHKDQVLSCDWSPCGGYIVSGSMDHTVRLWKVSDTDFDETEREANGRYITHSEERSLSSDQCASTGDLHTNYVDCVRFFDDFIISKSSEEVLMISKFGDFRDPVNGGCNGARIETWIPQLAQLSVPKGDTWFLRFDIDPRKEWLLCGVRSGEIYAWHLSPDRLPSTEPDCVIPCYSKAEKRAVRQIAFEPHGRMVACVTDDSTITLLKRTDWAPDHSKIVQNEEK